MPIIQLFLRLFQSQTKNGKSQLFEQTNECIMKKGIKTTQLVIISVQTSAKIPY
jgi:hypothetical protein